MGWALKSNTITRVRFNEKQKQYLMVNLVLESPQETRDSNGQRLFSSAEFLTSQQISSLFSRMAAKRTLPFDLAVNDVDEESTEYEQGLKI